MGITNANKQAGADTLECDELLKMTLALSASPDITTNPTDMVLVLDRSGSMAGAPLAGIKAGADAFIDIIAQATGGAPDGLIGSGSRIGIVSFAGTATANTQLITSVDDLKNAVNSLSASGSTNHADAFEKALQLFTPPSGNARVIVMFTDGKTTAGGDPSPIAAAARADGVIIYCIGLIGTDGIDVSVLNDWASDPDASHVAVTPDAADLEELFKDLAVNISKTGATDIVIDEILNADFVIVSVSPPTKGTAMMTDANTLQWKISELGVTANEGAALEFTVRHVADTYGEKLINESISYSDNEGNVVVFPAPSVTVKCGIIIDPGPCPIPVELTVDSCVDSVVFDAGDTYLESLGRIVQLDVTLRNVCPGKRVALAVILTETDDSGMEQPRGMKAFTLPAHDSSGCRDVLVRCIKFVLPEDLVTTGDENPTLCKERKLKARIIAHNIDTDFVCCDSDVTLT